MCSPRRSYVLLDEPKDRIVGFFGPLRRGFARLGEGRLPLGELVTVLRHVLMAYLWVSFMARFMIVCGLLRGHCMTCLKVSFIDKVVTCLGQYVCNNVFTCDEFVCENGHYIA